MAFIKSSLDGKIFRQTQSNFNHGTIARKKHALIDSRLQVLRETQKYGSVFGAVEFLTGLKS